ncbi:MAG TPA: HAD-IA family hydrolase, partial [Terriglobales bacterium]|nr:HAD-IA family hydrolase [Terriglobales bacterium]
EETIFAAERAARRFRDANANSDPKHTDQQYWDIYYSELLSRLPSHRDLLPDLVAAARTSANWCMVPTGTREQLLDLKQKYRLAVISNADGHIADLFVRVGLADLFETITDSGNVGFQKPHPEIFRAALRSLDVPAEKSVYVGDVYSIDYTGARGVGMNAIVMDPYGTYEQNGVPRVTNLAELEPMLAKIVSRG